MSSFLLALQFLTVLPFKVEDFSEKRMAWASAYFPAVGLFLGLTLVGLNTLLTFLGIPSIVISIFIVVALIILTGGMHLDGLSDTADAFLSGKSKDEMLMIMRDPHIGVMGVLSLISVILLKIGLIYSLGFAIKPIALILICVLSRWASVMAMYLFPYAREDGKAKLLIGGLNLKVFVVSLVTVLIFAILLLGIKGILVLVVVAGCTYLVGKLISRKIGGLTGDTLGALIELIEIITLITFCIA